MEKDKFVGKRLDSRYLINEFIGKGGMARLYKAYDTIDDRVVAIKILKEEFLNNAEFLRRFKNESKAIAVLAHPNIVKVYDVSFGDVIQYIVMEYIEGITLKDYIKEQKKIDYEESLHFITQILRALQHAHEKGIIHRDIKPQNIMLLKNGTIKVTDFGIARFTRNETRTMTDKAIGSVHYIAPEQARGDLTDAKTDIYSVGVMMYELLTGKLPFEADNAVSVAIMQLQSNPKSLREIDPNIPPALEEITLKAMEKNPKKRYQSAAEILTDIEAFRKDPNVRFEYRSSNTSTPSKYIDTIDSLTNTTGTKIPDSVTNQKTKKHKNSTTKYVTIGILVALLLIGAIFGIIAVGKSCSNSAEEVEIPNFIGMQYDDIMAEKEAGKYLFNFIKEDYNDETKPNGEVIDQNPKVSSKKIRANSDIKLTVNVNNKESVTVPDVKAMKQKDAVAKIESLGLVATVSTVMDDETASGVVKNTNPVAGTSVMKGSTVTVYVSTGPSEKKVTVPNVINDSLETAKKKIEAQGLKVGKITEEQSSQSKDIVLETDPLPSTSVSANSAVNIVVSSGKQKSTTYEVHVKLPTEITTMTTLNIYINDVLSVDREIIPAYNEYYTVNVTGSQGVSTVEVHVAGQLYWTYYVDFDNDGKITDEKNPYFIIPSSSIPSSSTASYSSSSKPTAG